MSFPRYPKYKASGVEWLGEVPDGWSVAPFKRQIARNDGGVWGDDPDGISDTIVLRSTEQTVDGRWQLDNPASRKLSGSDIDGALLDEGDLLLTKSSGSSLHIGKTTLVTAEIAEMRCCYSNFMQRIRTKPTFLPKLAWYVLNNQLARQQLDLVSNSTTGLANLNATMVGQLVVIVPPLPEQTAIAEFLDRETGKIDELVAEQRRLMELLKEKRQAVNSHAVTKGLNPHAPMKPSGIEWLGDVPEGWELKPLRSVFKFSKGLTITKENLQDEGVYCVNYGEVHSKYGFRLNPLVHPLRCVAPEYLLTNPDALIRDGDFVFADTSEDLEGSGNFTHLRSDDPIFAGYHTIIARPRKDTCSLFLAYQLHSSAFRSQIQRQVKGVKVFSISQGILKAAKCLMPPLPEQTAIAEFLEAELAKFDTLTAEAQRAIDLLQERRTALISAAVTGQIDVRKSVV
jgi:type I restriction enzyme S subunit